MREAFVDPMLSYSRGPENPPLQELCIGQVLDKMAERYPDSPALILRQESLRYTWRELKDEVERAARGLMALGFVKGDRVGSWATTSRSGR